MLQEYKLESLQPVQHIVLLKVVLRSSLPLLRKADDVGVGCPTVIYYYWAILFENVKIAFPLTVRGDSKKSEWNMSNLCFLYMNVGKVNSLKQDVLVLKVDHDSWSREKNWLFTILQPRSCLCIWGMHLLITLLYVRDLKSRHTFISVDLKAKHFWNYTNTRIAVTTSNTIPFRSSSRFFLPFRNVWPHTLKFVATGLVTCSERQVHEISVMATAERVRWKHLPVPTVLSFSREFLINVL